jgi:hypothetical protein
LPKAALTEAAEAVNSREPIIERLADITEVLLALRALHGIGERYCWCPISGWHNTQRPVPTTPGRMP